MNIENDIYHYNFETYIQPIKNNNLVGCNGNTYVLWSNFKIFSKFLKIFNYMIEIVFVCIVLKRKLFMSI